MDALKILFATLLSGIIAYLQPVHNAIIVLMFVFVGDIVFGIIEDFIVSKNKFNPKKFMLAFVYVALYTSIVAGVYVIGERMGDMEESIYVVKTLTYVFVYFYVSNSVRNLRKIFPNSKILAFLDFFLGLEFMQRIPALSAFMDREKNKNKEKEVENEPIESKK